MKADTAYHSSILYSIHVHVTVVAVLVVEVVLGSFSFPLPRRTHPAGPQGAGQHQPQQVHRQTTDA